MVEVESLVLRFSKALVVAAVLVQLAALISVVFAPAPAPFCAPVSEEDRIDHKPQQHDTIPDKCVSSSPHQAQSIPPPRSSISA